MITEFLNYYETAIVIRSLSLFMVGVLFVVSSLFIFKYLEEDKSSRNILSFIFAVVGFLFMMIQIPVFIAPRTYAVYKLTSVIFGN